MFEVGLSIFSFCVRKFTQKMFFRCDTSPGKISKPKQLLLVNIELLFDGKLKYTGFMELKSYSPPRLSPSRVGLEEGTLEGANVRLRFKPIPATPTQCSNLVGGESVRVFHGSLIKKVVLVNFNNQCAGESTEATYPWRWEGQTSTIICPKASMSLSVRRIIFLKYPRRS